MIMFFFNIRKHAFYSIITAFLIIILIGCKKLVDVNPPNTRISAGNVFSSDITAISVLTGLYSRMSGAVLDGSPSVPSISFWAGLSADELTLRSGASADQIAYYRNSLSRNVAGYEFWANAYFYIYAANAAIEGLSNSTTLTFQTKQQLLGEAKFIRSFFYFYLVNLFGDAPLVLSTDYSVNATLSRNSKEEIYQQIINDLKESKELMVEGYVKADAQTLYAANSSERVRPSKFAASALLARVYLYIGDYANAESIASELINNRSYFELQPLNKVFQKNSKEAIWQLQPVDAFIANTVEAYMFVLTVPPAGVNSTHPVYLSNSLLESFEPGDQRKTNGNWVNKYTDASGSYFYSYKYKNVITGTGVKPTEYSTLLRLSEQYLIRAEARAQQNKIAEANADLDSIRYRAGLPSTTATDKTSMLSAILHERQVELFTELGHRWLDLKRTGNVDAVMTVQAPLKGGVWQTYQQLYPILQTDVLRNPNLIQNSDY